MIDEARQDTAGQDATDGKDGYRSRGESRAQDGQRAFAVGLGLFQGNGRAKALLRAGRRARRAAPYRTERVTD